jgi:uncharacterized protein YgiM (DUF1202 family)
MFAAIQGFIPTVTPKYGIVTVGTVLNVRERPKFDARVMKKLSRNEKVQIKYESKDGTWYGVLVNGDIGWVYAEYIALETG